MATLKEEFRQNRPTWIWRGSLLALIGILGFLGSWVFAEVSAAPKEYATKVEVARENDRQNVEIRAMERKIDDGFKETQRIILDLHKQ